LHQVLELQKLEALMCREAQTIIRALNKINFVGGDVVEVSPPFDVNNMTSLVEGNNCL